MMDAKIISKIEKLLNLSKSSNEHEAALALQRAQKLMQEHNIDGADILLSKFSDVEVKEIVGAELIEPWVNALINLVCDSFGVDVVRTYHRAEFGKNGFNMLTLFGDKQRVLLAKYCYEVLAAQLKEARKNFNKSLPTDMKHKWKHSDSFCFGWVKAIESKVEKFALCEQEVELMKEYGNSLFPVVVQKKAQTFTLQGSAYHAGLEEGENVQLHHAVNGASQGRIS